jgi:hypothetical protein
MPDESKPGDKAPISVVGDVTKAIQDGWQFFAPATFRLLGAGLIVYILAGHVFFGRVQAAIKAALLSVDAQHVASVLDQYKLTSIMPIAALFAFALSIYAFNRCVATVAAFVPIQFAYSLPILVFTKCHGESVWYRIPQVGTPDGLLEAIEVRLAKARAEGYQALLDNADGWSKVRDEAFSQARFIRFLFLWSIGWTIALAHRPGVPGGLAIRLLFVLGFLTYCLVMSFVLAANAIEKMTDAKASAAVALLTLDGKDEIASDDERKSRIDSAIAGSISRHGWWWFQLGGPIQWLLSLADLNFNRTLLRPPSKD